jgi:hypothetical protein
MDMKYVIAALTAVVAGGVAGFYWPAKADEAVAMDSPVTVNGIETVCTGIGDDAQHDPRWAAYPVRVEFSNSGSQYLSGAHVVLATSAGKTLATLDCAGPWVLFKLAHGSYKVTATLTGDPASAARSTKFSPPSSGQKRVPIIFPLKANE